MQNPPSLPPKPVAEILRPELTRLPEYNFGRWLARRVLKLVEYMLVATRLRLNVRGVENFPAQGPALIVFNHLGDADIVVILSQLRAYNIDPLAASNLYDIPALRIVSELYGVIWLHRGHPDRRALNCAIESLRLGRFVTIAPEGRESVAGGLEQGLDGAAFLALRADVPIVPIGITGTENPGIYRGLFSLPRHPVSMTVGQPFRLVRSGNRHLDLENSTNQIMHSIARLLPPEYQGAYRQVETSPVK
jgi:1-acyl-sn-glycerol-3-phosphate acyltransferase